MVDTGIMGLETGLVFRDEFLSGEKVKNFDKNKSFIYFPTNQKGETGLIIFNVFFVALFVNGKNIFFLPFRREKHTSKNSLLKNQI